MHIVRGGRQWTVHWSAFRRYRGKLLENFDIVIDEVNTVPFFTPLWAKVPIVMFIHQLAREVWWYEAWFPLNAIGFLLEPLYLRLYRNVPAVTVSASTRYDLRRLGFKSTITIVPVGIEPIEPSNALKSTEGRFLYVGRLAPSKRIGHMIEALAQFRQETGTGTLWLAGTGSKRYQESLFKLARRLKVEDSIEFWGRVSAVEKHRLMGEARALLMTSVREGWGLVVTEANACGTPAIVYDVPGLRDSVRNESTGLIVSAKPSSLAEAMVRLWNGPLLQRTLATQAEAWSRDFSFEQTAHVMRTAMSAALSGEVESDANQATRDGVSPN